MQRKSIYAFISCLAISLLLVSQNAAAQRRKEAEVPDTLPFYRGTAVSADLLGAGMAAFADYGQYEGAARVNLRGRYFPVVEIGCGRADHTDDVTGTRYKTGAPYGRVGIDFNILRNKNDIYRLYCGVRYAYTAWKYDLEHPAVTDPVWGARRNMAALTSSATTTGRRRCSALRPRYGARCTWDGACVTDSASVLTTANLATRGMCRAMVKTAARASAAHST